MTSRVSESEARQGHERHFARVNTKRRFDDGCWRPLCSYRHSGKGRAAMWTRVWLTLAAVEAERLAPQGRGAIVYRWLLSARSHRWSAATWICPVDVSQSVRVVCRRVCISTAARLRHGRSLAIAKFAEHLKADAHPHFSLWSLSGLRLVFPMSG